MNTKLSVALLAGVSLFMSVGAFAVAEDTGSDYLNWSYAMGDTAVKSEPAGQIVIQNKTPETVSTDVTCTEGCPGRPDDSVQPLTLTYEDEAAPIVERADVYATDDRFPSLDTTNMRPVRRSYDETNDSVEDYPVSAPMPIQNEAPVADSQPRVNTQFVTTTPKIQYPITRQYPISVQYPITVQRNMTIEQPVVMQQPVIVRRPVVMQQDITVQRQPTVIQHQPVVMQQQPTYVQQQPVYVQAPAQPIAPNVFSGFPMMMPQIQSYQAPVQPQPEVPAATDLPQPQVDMGMPQQVTLPPVYQQVPPAFVQQPAPMMMPQAQPYPVQGQAQPVYIQQPYMPAQQPMPMMAQPQPVYLTPTY